MAEAFGIVAGGLSAVSLGVQIAESISRLRNIFTAIRDAPSSITSLLDEVSVLSLVLNDIDQSIQDGSFHPPAYRNSLQRSLQLCNASNNALEALLRDLENDIRKAKKWGSVKAGWWKKEKIAELRGRIEGAKSTLVLANQVFDRGATRQDWETQRKEMSEMKLTISTLVEVRSQTAAAVIEEMEADIGQNSEDMRTEVVPRLVSLKTSTMTRKRTVKTRKHWQNWLLGRVHYQEVSLYQAPCDGVLRRLNDDEEVEEVQLTIHMPKWLVSRHYQFWMKRTFNGWDYHMRSTPIVPSDSPVFKVCLEGDLASLQQLFQRKEASPFDMNASGLTPLHYAAAKAQVEVVRFLLENGADPKSRASNLSLTPLCSFLLMEHLVLAVENQLLRLLEYDFLEDDSDVGHFSPFRLYRGTPNGLSFLLTEITSEGYQMYERPIWDICWSILLHPLRGAEYTQVLLNSAVGRTSLLQLDSYGYSILQRAILRWIVSKFGPNQERMLRVIIRSEINAQILMTNDGGLLRGILAAKCSCGQPCGKLSWVSRRQLRSAVYRWLYMLQHEGVDLQILLEKEYKHWATIENPWASIPDRIVKVEILHNNIIRIEWESDEKDEDDDWADDLEYSLPMFWKMASDGVMGDYDPSEEFEDVLPRMPGGWE